MLHNKNLNPIKNQKDNFESSWDNFQIDLQSINNIITSNIFPEMIL